MIYLGGTVLQAGILSDSTIILNPFAGLTRLMGVYKTQTITDVLMDLGLVPQAEQRAVAKMERRSPDQHRFLAELFRAGKLTRLQATQIGRGRGHHLMLGQYLLLDRLGSGGMGRVFLARHRTLGRLAALKLVRLDRRHCPNTKARFLREVCLISRLNHENVVHAHDAGIAHQSCFLAMEFIPGPDLGRVIVAKGALDIGWACEYARQAATGLQHLHDQGLIHRDLKPANLGLAKDGRLVKVLDIGLARSRENEASDTDMSQARKLMGSPDYASPEQILDARRVDPRADLYGLGCTLYHLLTGSVPFPGGTVLEKALKHLSEAPRPIEEFRSDLPSGLGYVVRRLMARRRTARFPTAGEVASLLASYATPLDAATAPTRQLNDTVLQFQTSASYPTLSILA